LQCGKVVDWWSKDGENSDDYATLDQVNTELEAVAPAFFRLVAAGQNVIQKDKQIETYKEEIERAGKAVEIGLERVKELEEALTKKNVEITGAEKQIEDINTRLEDVSREKTMTERRLNQCFSETAILTGIVKEREVVIEQQSWLRELLVLIFSIRHSANSFAKLKAFLFIPFHFASLDGNLKRLGLFDADKYLSLYPDVAESKMDPLWHYLRYGLVEGRKSGMDNANNGMR